MSDISPIQRPTPAALNGFAKAQRLDTPTEAKSRGSDRVELSDHARYLGKLRELPPIREGLVEAVKAEIDAETYETPERIDKAVDALVDDLL